MSITDFFRYEFKQRFDPFHDYLKQAIRGAFAVSLAILLFRFFPQFSQGYLLIFVAAFITQTRVGETASEQLLSVAVCGMLATLVAIIAVYAAESMAILAIYLALLGALVVLYGSKSYTAFIRIYFIVLFALISSGLPLNGASVLERGLFMLIGTGCSLIASCLWIEKLSTRFDRGIIIFQHTVLEFMYQEILCGLNEGSRRKNEERLHERRSRYGCFDFGSPALGI